MYPGRPVSSWLSTTIESGGISTAFRVSRLIELWAKATKGTTKKARTRNANILFIIFFLLLINMLEAPPGTRTLKYARCSATVVPAEKLEPWADIPEQFQNQTQSTQKRRDSNGVFKQIRGSVKKDTCGAERTLPIPRRPSI